LEVTEEEIIKFYNDNKDDYKQNEKRDLSYVIFEIKTTAKDTAHVISEFDQIKNRLSNGESFNDLAVEFSVDPSVQSNKGDLGFFERTAMVKPFADAAFSAKVGELVGPVETSFGMHLINVEDRKVEEGKEKVKASHILLKVTPAPSSMEEQESKSRFFSEDAQQMGFVQMAEKDSLEILTTGLFEERSGFIPGKIGRNPAVMNFAFISKLNDVSGVYRLDDGYAVFMLNAIQEEGYQDLETVRRFVENRVKLEKAKEIAKDFALQLSSQVQSDTDFKSISETDTSKKAQYNVTGMIAIDGNVPGVGKAVEFNAAAFALDIGQRSDLVETDRGYYYLHLLEKTEFDSSSYSLEKDMLSRRLLSEKRNQIFADWYDELKEKADIEDNRKLFNL